MAGVLIGLSAPRTKDCRPPELIRYRPSVDIEFKTKGVSLTFYNQWEVLKRGSGSWNWVDITLIELSFEYSPYKYSSEINFGLLGFNWTLTLWKKPEAHQ